MDEELLDVASASLQAGLQEYGHQAVANTFYSLARLQHYNAELCAAVDKHVSQNMSEFTPQVRLIALDTPASIPGIRNTRCQVSCGSRSLASLQRTAQE